MTVDDIRKEIPGFMPPQMYYVLDNHPKLKDILEKQVIGSKEFVHKHDGIYYDNLAMSVSELKDTDEFKRLDLLHSNDYGNIIF